MLHGPINIKYQDIYKWQCQYYQRVSVSDPTKNEGRNENETSPLRTTEHVDWELIISIIALNHKKEETKQMTTKYLKQAPSSEIVTVSLFKPFLYFGKYNASKWILNGCHIIALLWYSFWLHSPSLTAQSIITS